MKIAIVSDTIFPEQINGVARTADLSARALAKRGHEVRVFSIRDAFSVPFWGYKGLRLALPTGQTYRALKRFRPDIIHTHTPFDLGWEAVLAAKALAVPLVGTHHTFFDHYLKHVHLDFGLMRKLSWKYLVWHYNHYDAVLSPSPALLDGLAQEGLKRKLILFPNAIDTDFFQPLKKPKEFAETLVYVGRVSYEKSIGEVVKALNLVVRTHPQAKLVIVGDGPERQRLEALVRELGLSKNVRFTGMLQGEALLHAYRSGDLFVTASQSENMPLSVMEAMACGLPILGVAALGIPELVKNGKNGYVVAPDNLQAMSEKILELFANRARRELMGKASRELALQYGQAANADKLEKIYQSLCK